MNTLKKIGNWFKLFFQAMRRGRTIIEIWYVADKWKADAREAWKETLRVSRENTKLRAEITALRSEKIPKQTP